jgi:hypothetical protein
MPSPDRVLVKNLKIDLNNYRVTKQNSETAEINALISAKPNKFWALMNSLLDDGYHPTENIIVLQKGSEKIVKEGNRRIASLKIILGFTKIKLSELPSDIVDKIQNLTAKWKSVNKKIPCIIYDASVPSEVTSVEKIVALTHGKGASAGRDIWNAVARARHNKDMGLPEYGLDVLEIFSKKSTLISKDTVNRWGGDYPLTVLDEAVSKMCPLLEIESSQKFASSYPKIKLKKEVDSVIFGIGMADITFKDVRTPDYFYQALDIPLPTDDNPTSTPGDDSDDTDGKKKPTSNKEKKKPISYANTDPRFVKAILRKFKPMGSNREKLVALLYEIKKLNIENHSHAFCFLLRSMFEISAKVYAKEEGINAKKADGNDKPLATLLRDIHKKLTNNKKDREMLKLLHGPMTEIEKPNGLLSVTSLNQLVHNPKFSIVPSDICRLFGNVFPLLEVMNK